MDIDTSAGASTKVQARVLYAFWGFVFSLAFLIVFAGLAIVINFLRAGTVPNVAWIFKSVDSTQAILALGAIGYVLWKVGMVFVVATFGREDARAGTELAEETKDELQEADD